MPRFVIGSLLAFCHASLVFAQASSPADVAFFESKVRPLLIERCHECHSAKSKKIKGKLLLDSQTAILKGGESGPAVVLGKPDESLLILAVRYTKDDLQMPPTRKLAKNELAILEEWVRRGVPYPGSTVAVKKNDGIDWSEGRKFWSFQFPKAASLPVVSNKAWPRNRLDTLLLAEMEKRGLTPSPQADPRVLIRRATFDLTGLPPLPEDIEAFVKACAGPNAKTQAAYEALVDRLLASPDYGERWARVWLDLARYCDIAEPWAEGKGQPWLYRDWVVRAFNEDLPYHQFVIKQLAADLLPSADPRDRAALGFLGLSPQYWKELLLDKDVIKGVVAEEWEERINAIGSTFLGLGIACARCHDHKFDPISTQDYYALAGVLASTKHADLSLLSIADGTPVLEAHTKIQKLQEQIKKAGKPKDDTATKQIAAWQAEINAIKKATPNVDQPLARGVIDSSLHVLAEGVYKTKLVYKPNESQDVAVQIRGNPANLGPVVPRRFLSVLADPGESLFRQGSGRLELANAIVTKGAPLSGRVIVNRIWKQHLGTGLVDTPSDFGSQGTRPTPPELLDDLTRRFMLPSPSGREAGGEGGGWSLKWLHREIMLSATYQQASTHDEKKHKTDPDNRWLWRMNRRRLDVEMWRDAALLAAGTLDRTRGGATLDLSDPKNQRRTIYGTVKRRELNDMLRLFDFPDPTIHAATRIPTTTPLQQLFTLNSPFMQQQASALVKRLKTEVSDEERVRLAYRLLYGREATAPQMRLAMEFLGRPSSDESWRQYAQVLLGSNEFLFVD